MKQHRKKHRALAVVAAITTASVVLVGCSVEPLESPSTDHRRLQDEPISISINSGSMEQMVLGEIYHQVLRAHGRSSSLAVATKPDEQNQINRLRELDANFVIGCTGNLLGNLNPTTAKEMRDEVGIVNMNTYEQIELSHEVYTEFVGSLPGDFMTIDPSPAVGCQGAPSDILSQNIVPVFYKGLFDRGEINALNTITRILTTDELQRLVDRARRVGSASDVVAAWLGSKAEEQEEKKDTESSE
ncbi:hypothetical protein QP027_04080 [Corynebacterium breve]|uniref:Uncharacterized protein n=1 Tax=Corynebacterium breve TaxID=3049799 RepID=A0ABY8VGF4_9CORY|nr:hypothetical protein [Corynebacterium breve]WIM68579.1 hypothetical protein QP027_04080 [Corynebacterium breve]